MKFKRESDGVEIELVGDWQVMDIPAPGHWVDVTDTCSFKHGVLLDHPEEGGHGWTVLTCQGTVHSDEYRMRKVSVERVKLGDTIKGYAFIVERKEDEP